MTVQILSIISYFLLDVLNSLFFCYYSYCAYSHITVVHVCQFCHNSIYPVFLCDGISAVEVANNAKKNCGTTVPVKIRSFAKNMDDTSM